MEWIVENSRETRARNFYHRDALFLLFKVRDKCVGPSPPPPLPPLSPSLIGSGLRSWNDNKNPVVGKRIIPEVPIPVADRKDRGLWERDCRQTDHPVHYTRASGGEVPIGRYFK